MDSAQPNPLGVPLRRPAIPSGVLGMLVFIVCEVMFFAGMISANTIARSNAMKGMWPPPGQPLLPAVATLANTGVLIASGIVGYLAWRRFQASPASSRPLLGATIALGAVFVGLQGTEWAALLAQGMTMKSSQLGAFFYLIVGTHAVHAVAALVALGMAFARLRRDALGGDYLMTTLVFWWFVVAMWPLIYGRVYF